MPVLLKLTSVNELLAYCEETERTHTSADVAQTMCGIYVKSEWASRLNMHIN